MTEGDSNSEKSQHGAVYMKLAEMQQNKSKSEL